MANKAEIIITASDKTQQAFNSVRSSLNGLSSLAGNLGLGAAFSVAGIVAFTKNSINALDRLNDLSKTTGIAVDKLSGLDLAAKQSGTDLDALAKSVAVVSKNIGTNSKEFAALGVTATEPLEAFKQLADIFVKIEDPFQRAAFANKAFGKSWQEIAPLLAEGGANIGNMVDRGRELSGVTKEMAEQADKFNDQLAELEVSSKATGNEFAKILLPSLNDTAQAMRDLAKEGHPLLALLRGFVGLGKIPFDLAFPAEDLKQATSATGIIKDLKKELADLETSKSKLQKTGGGLLNELVSGGDIKALDQKILIVKNKIAGFEKFKEQLANPAEISAKLAARNAAISRKTSGDIDGLKDFIGGEDAAKKTKAAKSGGKSETETAAEDLAKLIKSFQEATAPSQTLSENLQSQLDSYAKLDPQIKNYLQNIIDQTAEQEALSKSVEDTNAVMEGVQQANEEAQARINAFSDEYQAILKETQDINASLIENDQERASAQLEIDHQRRIERIANMELEADEIDALLEAENERFAVAAHKNADEFKKIGSGAKDLGLVFKSAFEEAVTSGSDFGDVLDGLGKDIEKLAARRFILEPLLNSFDELFKKMTGGSGGGGDFFSGLIDSFVGLFTSNADGGVYSSPSLSAFSGGVYNTPQLFKFAKGAGVFAEAGPEAILPLKRGPNGQLGVQGNGMGGANVTVNIIGAPAQPQVSQRNDGNGTTTIDVIFDTIKGALTKDIRSEGPFAQALQGQYGLNRAAGAY